MNIDISEVLIKQAMKNIDLAQYEKYVEEAIDAYFKSEDFTEQVIEALSDEGFGWEIVKPLKASLHASLKKMKFEVKV